MTDQKESIHNGSTHIYWRNFQVRNQKIKNASEVFLGSIYNISLSKDEELFSDTRKEKDDLVPEKM